jgi:hypothetical protein
MKIGEFIRARQAEGLSDRDILPLVYREFSGAKTTLNSIRWYRWKDKEEVACVPRAQGDVMTLVANERAEEAGPVNSIGIEYSVLKKEGVESLISFKTAQEIADELRQYLQQTEIQEQIRVRHVLGASSMSIQELVLRKALELGFEDEKMGLFANYGVPGLRPDYYCQSTTPESCLRLSAERPRPTIWTYSIYGSATSASTQNTYSCSFRRPDQVPMEPCSGTFGTFKNDWPYSSNQRTT